MPRDPVTGDPTRSHQLSRHTCRQQFRHRRPFRPPCRQSRRRAVCHTVPPVTTPSNNDGSIRIDAAGSANYTDANGVVWSKDKYYSGGSSTLTAIPINNTPDAVLYYDRRFGKAFSYAIPVVPGDYTLNLSFADSGYKVGQRTFNVFAEGSQILSAYDIAKDGENLVITKSFHVTVTDGTLNLSFAGIVGNATLSTIEVVPSSHRACVVQWRDRSLLRPSCTARIARRRGQRQALRLRRF